MFIAQDVPLTASETRLFTLYCQTYPTDLTKFKEYQRLTARLHFSEQIKREFIRECVLLRAALRKITLSAGKTYHGQPNDLTWCVRLAQSTLTSAQNKETK